ncbi:MAG TPA: endonuclease/exonuclease/phosphatase family protein [Sphingomonas sp.]|nr:endonuclease/exonuclease/phosphatase family protein [Sphingomonas sp.]
MTYNVEGLPWPVRWGRDAQAAKIGASLGRLRERGTQPHVIVLQEAFTPAAKAIAIQAGYRYIADGPGRDARGEPASSPQDRQFVADASLLLGETQGKWADSGLRIASDYPILRVSRMAFPEYACAGLDCLANKGILAVTLAVPGTAAPIVIVATHLNSRKASGASHARSFYAYRRQIDAVGTFIRANVPIAWPMVFAGDFNAGQRIDRRSYLIRNAASWRPQAGLSVALDTCLAARDCRKDGKADIIASYRHGRDWQFYSPGRFAGLQVATLSAPFGHDRSGAMLSDHIGYVAAYRIRPLRTALPVRLATR